MVSCFHKFDKSFLCFFIFRSFGDEFRSIVGDILSYLSSNIGNEENIFKSSCNTDHRRHVMTVMTVMTVNNFVISYQVHVSIICILLIPAMLFINYSLFLVVRKSRKKKRISPELKKTFSLKNISSCLMLAVACIVVSSIPWCVYIGLRINSPETKNTLDNANLAGMWATTMSLMNCTFNCLIFYCKNKVLLTEGWKVLKSMKICRRVES
jgi:amino acid transporter